MYPHRTRKGTTKYTPSSEFDVGNTTFFPVTSQPHEESLLFLAVPKGADFGELQETLGLCYLDDSNWKNWVPSDYAMLRYNYTVYPAGSKSSNVMCDIQKLDIEQRQSITADNIEFLETQANRCKRSSP